MSDFQEELDAIADDLNVALEESDDKGAGSFYFLFWRLLASMPGGEGARELGYEPLLDDGLSWDEVGLLHEVLCNFDDDGAVEYLVSRLSVDGSESD